MKKIMDWMDKPFTNKAYVIWVGIGAALAAIFYAIYFTVLFWDEICQKVTNVFDKVKDFFTVRVKIHRDEAG